MKEITPNDRAVCRYALVELVNVHDEGLDFEPIHRVLFDVELSKVLTNLKNFFGKNLIYRMYNSEAEMNKYTPTKDGIQSIPFLSGNQWGVLILQNPPHNLAVGSLQLFLDAYIKAKNIKVDYVHGTEAVKTLASKTNCIGFFLPKIKKTDLFKTVILDGTLPRKTFSMGEAEEKRFYLECRRIIPEVPKKSLFKKRGIVKIKKPKIKTMFLDSAPKADFKTLTATSAIFIKILCLLVVSNLEKI